VKKAKEEADKWYEENEKIKIVVTDELLKSIKLNKEKKR